MAVLMDTGASDIQRLKEPPGTTGTSAGARSYCNLPGHPGRSLHRNRIIVLTMVENLGKSGAGGTGKGIGRARLAVLPNYQATTINAELVRNLGRTRRCSPTPTAR